jgi:hypothetical protein
MTASSTEDFSILREGGDISIHSAPRTSPSGGASSAGQMSEIPLRNYSTSSATPQRVVVELVADGRALDQVLTMLKTSAEGCGVTVRMLTTSLSPEEIRDGAATEGKSNKEPRTMRWGDFLITL